MGNLHGYLEQSARAHAERPCMEAGGSVWRYGEVYQQTLCFAERLRESGVRRGETVLLYMENSVEYAIAFFALLSLGAVAVPLNTAMSAEAIRAICADTGARFCITAGSAPRRAGLWEGLERISLCAEEPLDAVARGERALSQALEDEKSPASGFAYYPDEELAVLLYTSGTSAAPKGVMLTHKNLEANTRAILAYLPITENDSVLVTLSFAYSYGNSLLLTHIKAGARLVLSREAAYPQRILAALEGVTGFSTVGSYLHRLLGQENCTGEAFRGLRYITFAGEACAPEDLEALHALCPALAIYVMYGQTEAGARLSYLPPEKLGEKRGSAGRAIEGVQLRIADSLGRPLAPGSVGEVLARGETIMRGYWKQPEATREKLRDGWLHTGDLAYMDAEGYLFIVGRSNDVIKYMGRRIGPLEIENALNQCENVLESAVVEGRDGDGQARIEAYIVPRDAALPVGDLREALRGKLPAYEIPQVYSVVEALPKTANGKLKRAELRK